MTPIIVGAGVGGLAVALALHRAGTTALVLERAPTFRDVGAGLLLAPRAVSVLRSLGVFEQALARAHSTDEWRILDPKGKILSRVRLSSCALSLHRADLIDVLHQALPAGTVRCNAPVKTISTDSRGTIEITMESGETIATDALVGADGLRSRVRSYFKNSSSRYRGYIGWRGIAPCLPSQYTDRWLSESWGEGQRFGIAAIAGRRCYWYASANVSDDYDNPSANRKADLLARFGHWHAPVSQLITATPDDAILADAIRDCGIGTWPRSHVPITLLGDAAHAMTPNLGQGACQALEDAEVLGQAWAKAANPTSAFRAYEQARRRRTTFVQTASHTAGWLVQLQNPLLTFCRDRALQLLPDALPKLFLRSILHCPRAIRGSSAFPPKQDHSDGK
jgi:2-polyprenyl-6-methoxyphenol hydroxylase-like FAD-dependent oxidoreductase